MENKSFIDISGLSEEDWKDINRTMKEYEITFGQALAIFMREKPGIARVVGEFKDGKIQRDEISMDGVKEFKGEDAFKRMINDVNNNKKGENDK